MSTGEGGVPRDARGRHVPETSSVLAVGDNKPGPQFATIPLNRALVLETPKPETRAT